MCTLCTIVRLNFQTFARPCAVLASTLSRLSCCCTQVKVKGANKISFQQFQEALSLVADKKVPFRPVHLHCFVRLKSA